MKKASKPKKTTVCVQGMHCASCDILVASKFSEIAGIKNVKADHVTQQVELEYEGELDKKALENSIHEFGYTLAEQFELEQAREPYFKRVIDAVVLGMICMLVYFVAGEMNLIPAAAVTTLSLGSAFLVGIVASLSTCMATTGALYMATIGKLHDQTASWRQKMAPAVAFNAGRIITYTVLGAINGYVGKLLSKDLNMGVTLNLLIGIMMVFIGLDMLKILPLDRLLPGGWFRKLFLGVERRLLKHPRRTSFLLGVSTYWLPCGFTQSVQLYALSLADPVQGALIMLAFVLGTTPVLLAMGYASSVMKTTYYAWFMKVVAVIVTLIGLSYVLNFLTLYGINPLPSLFSSSKGSVNSVQAQESDSGEQVIHMTVTYQGYTPNQFTVQHGRPVKWIIEGKEVYGCQGYLVAPKAEVETALKPGTNVITFLPTEPGDIGFSCSMGMYRGHITVL